jgi:putative phosphoesterase
MIIGLMSDSHDNVPLVKAAVKAFRERSVQAILHAGDIVSPFTARELLAAGAPVYAVFGNNDGEKKHLPEILEHIRESPYRFELAGRIFLLAHDRDAVPQSEIDSADVFVFGHTHLYHLDSGPPLVINPGEAGGWLTGRSTAAVLDTETLEVGKIELG